MKWYDKDKYQPKHGTEIWLWNKKMHRKEIFYAGWDESAWNQGTWPDFFSPMWSYVFEDCDPLIIQSKEE